MYAGNRITIPVIFIATLSLGACATNQIEHRQAAEQKARGVSGDVWVASNQIDATMLSLDNLMTADASQLPQAYERYSADVDLMRKDATLINADGAALQKQSESQLAEWHKQNNDLRNTDLHENSEQGRRAVWDRSHGMQGAYDRAQSSMDGLLRNLEDVRTALRNDLSTRGVSGIAKTNVQQRAHARAGEAKADLQQVQADSRSLAEALSASAAPVAATEGGASDNLTQR